MGILNIGYRTNTSSEGEELIKIPSDILLKKGNDSKNCGKHIYQFAGEVSTAGIVRRESNIFLSLDEATGLLHKNYIYINLLHYKIT